MNPLLKYASLAVASLVALSAHAQLINISTGQPGVNGALDLNYKLVSAPLAYLTDPTAALAASNAVTLPTSVPLGAKQNVYRVLDTGFPVGTNWMANSTTSGWIEPHGNNVDNAPAGNYVFETTFSLTNPSLSSTILKFRAAVDNSITAVRLNGTLLASSISGFTAFSGVYTFNNPGSLLAGTNSLTFEVVNNPQTNFQNPLGLRVEGTVTITPVPEPSTYAAMGAASLFVVGMLRRRKLGSRPVAA